MHLYSILNDKYSFLLYVLLYTFTQRAALTYGDLVIDAEVTHSLVLNCSTLELQTCHRTELYLGDSPTATAIVDCSESNSGEIKYGIFFICL